MFLPEPAYLLLHLDQLVLFGFSFILSCLIPVMNFYFIEVGFALIDLRWWRVVNGLIVSVGLCGAGTCTNLAGARCNGGHIDLL
jgi:hypothetical protein